MGEFVGPLLRFYEGRLGGATFELGKNKSGPTNSPCVNTTDTCTTRARLHGSASSRTTGHGSFKPTSFKQARQHDDRRRQRKTEQIQAEHMAITKDQHEIQKGTAGICGTRLTHGNIPRTNNVIQNGQKPPTNTRRRRVWGLKRNK